MRTVFPPSVEKMSTKLRFVDEMSTLVAEWNQIQPVRVQ